jgi:hypothetical protein
MLNGANKLFNLHTPVFITGGAPDYGKKISHLWTGKPDSTIISLVVISGES